jgi:hypothetical protein
VARQASRLILSEAHYEGDKLVARHVQNAAPILEANKEARKHSDENWAADPDTKKVASVDAATYLKWEAECKARHGCSLTQHPQFLMQMLEANPQYKTTEKRLL